jgi:hypothetical protein
MGPVGAASAEPVLLNVRAELFAAPSCLGLAAGDDVDVAAFSVTSGEEMWSQDSEVGHRDRLRGRTA